MSAPQLQVVWSGVLEREKRVLGLSSSLTTCVTAIAMRQAPKYSELTIKWPKPSPRFCARCGKLEERQRCNGKGEFGPFGKTCKGCRVKENGSK